MKHTVHSGFLRKAACIGLAALLAGCPSAAEMPDDGSEDTEAGAALPSPERREGERVRKKLERLERNRERLEELKRTDHPFFTERELRHQLRRNEAEQRWYKHEQDRLDVERRRAEDRARQLRRQ